MKSAKKNLSRVGRRPARPKAQPIPPHLREHIAKQRYELYTAIDHASWRYILRVSKEFFRKHAHQKYVTGLADTGISTERIPRISEMDEKLKKFGWRAVTVTGFIPPSVFLEFQSLSILPIACDMRRLEHLEYTPSPDIVHEAAGHAPILSDPSYASYLHKFGEIARKAIFAKEDLEVYEAVKHLSDIKEDPRTTQAEIDQAYKRLEDARQQVTYASEATKLSRLGWWSIEYGLVKVKRSKAGEEYKIYGAGLLSSLGESYDAIMTDVKKVPLDLGCVDVDYDITKPQPQLFYVESFKQLEGVIEELASTMAFRLGGVKALERARVAGTVTTAQLDSGLQISGVLASFQKNEAGQPIYLQFRGPTQLAFLDQELKGHSAKYHAEGYGTPLGRLKGAKKELAEMTKKEMEAFGLKVGQRARLEFASGVTVDGVLKKDLTAGKKRLVLTFADCEVRHGDKVLFQPEWGMFDMACGETVPSVFGGAADRVAYQAATDARRVEIKSQTSNITHDNRKLIPLYEAVREIRERTVGAKRAKKLTSADTAELKKISESLDQHYPQDWLLRLEILELLKNAEPEVSKKLNRQLAAASSRSSTLATLIQRGLEILP